MNAMAGVDGAPPEQGTNKSADRTLTVLEHLATARRRLTLAELAAALGIPKSSLHGLLRTLRTRGWVSTDESGLRFGLGVRALLVGTSYLATDDIVLLADHHLDELNTTLAETVHLGRLDADQIVYLAKKDAPHPLRLVSMVGGRLPSHATAMGKALLAELTDEQVVALLPARLSRLTEHTITSRAALLAELAAIRVQGYSEDREESSDGVVCVAVAVPTTRPAGYAISCSVPVTRMTTQARGRVVASLSAAVRALTEEWRLTSAR